MPIAAKSDADCIESGYEDALASLFKQFFNSVAGQPNKEKEYLAAFAAGLNTLRRLKALALAAAGAPPMAAGSPTMTVAATKSSRRRRA